ncbi:MAG TPA: YadA-like family protein, partial [Buttiauxella sp.]|uniref:YadA C-terminal domain-containing protein n=1 Tax=Buttiauxella sp. TaxID=1972222 RepID=UPI002B45D211
NQQRTANQHVSPDAGQAAQTANDVDQQQQIDGLSKTLANQQRTANQHVSPDAGQAAQTANDVDQQKQIDGLSKTLANQQRTASQHVTATSTPATVTLLTGASKKELKAEQVARKRADYQQKQAAYAQRQDIDLNSYHTQVNRAAIENNQQAIVSNTQHLDSLEKRQNQQDKTIKDNDKRASAGISAAFAMASIPQVTESQQFALGAGAGTYNSESAVSVGASFHATSNTIVKLNVSADTESNFGAGVGASIGWQ